MRRRKLWLAGTAVCLLTSLAVVSAVFANRTDVAQRQTSAEVPVVIYCDGAQRQIRTAQTTVGATLKEAGIELSAADKVHPKPATQLTKGMEIRIVRVVNRTIVEKLPIGYRTIRKPSSELRPGLVREQTEGKRGEKLVYYSVSYEDGTEVESKVLRSEVITTAIDRVILVGQQGANTSRGFVSSRRVIKMQASAYDPGPRSCGKHANGRTATGMKAGFGVVAVDPKVIKLGTRLYIDGYGFAIAGDTGRSIKGNRIDLGFDTYAAAKKFGRKTVTVHVLD